jgi:hypothetical protein
MEAPPPMAAPPPMEAPPGERPTIVMILGALFIVVGIMNFGVGGWGMTFATICGLPNLFWGIILLLLGIFIIMMKRWAWLVGLVFSILGFIWSLLLMALMGWAEDLAGDALPNVFLYVTILIFVFFLILMIVAIMSGKHFKKMT